MNFNFALSIFIFKFLIVISTALASETDWTVHIKVSVQDSKGADGTVWNHLVAGTREGATDGFDTAHDTISMIEVHDDPKVNDPVQAMFTHGILPEDKNNDGMIDHWTCSMPEAGYTRYNCSLWRDIRAFETTKTWTFLVLSPLKGASVTLTWSFDNKPEGVGISLIDLTDSIPVMNMKDTSIYSYTNTLAPGKKYGIRYFQMRMEGKGLFITPPLLPDGTMGNLYNQRFSAIGGSPAWSLEEGGLPPGLSFDLYSGEIAGTPVATGSYRFTVRGDDPLSGFSASREYMLTIHSMPEIDIPTLPDGVAGTDYNSQIRVTGGSGPMIWLVHDGNLPEGLTLDSERGTLSGRLLVPGIYDFTVLVKDANGATASKDFRITVMEPRDERPPEAIRDLRGVYLTDTSLLLLWSAPLDDSMTGASALYDLRYIENCPGAAELDEGTWSQSIEATGEPRPQAGAIQTYTLTGLKTGKTYCIGIRSMDASGHVSSLSNIVTAPLSSGMGMTGFSGSTSSLILRKGYNLISFPFIPVPNGRDSLLGPALGSPVALYRWYSAYPGIIPPQYYSEDIVMPGLGYFLYSPDDHRLDIDGLGIEASEYRVPLQAGWNMIGTPYIRTFLLSDLLIENSATKEIKSYIDAVKAGWIGNTVYQLKTGNYDFASFNDDPPAALEPWVGYWIYVNHGEGVEIIFRRP